MAERSVRLLIVDDHEIVRLGLITLFRAFPTFTIVGEAGTANRAIELARDHAPDVVLMDVRLPDESGIAACRDIRSMNPSIRVIMLTSFADESAVIASVTAGASGYLLKQSDGKRLVEAVEVVARGGSLLDPDVTTKVFSWLQRFAAQRSTDPLAVLSEQERKIVPMLVEGKTNHEIAELLCVSDHTVKTHVSNILQKLHLSRRQETAAYLARHQGFLTVDARTPPNRPAWSDERTR